MTDAQPKGKLATGFSSFRDLVQFGLGVALIIREVFFNPSEPNALVLGLGAGLAGAYALLERREHNA